VIARLMGSEQVLKLLHDKIYFDSRPKNQYQIFS